MTQYPGFLLGAAHIGALCLAHTKIPDSQKESKSSAQIALFVFQFSSVTQSCPTLCNPTNCSTPGLLVYHQLPESTKTHVHWVSDATRPSHPLSSPSPPAPNFSQHQSLFVSSSYPVAKVLEFQLQHQLLFVFRCIKPPLSVREWWEPWNQFCHTRPFKRTVVIGLLCEFFPA